MALSPSAVEQSGTADHSDATARADAIDALRNAHPPTQLAAWLDHYATSSPSTGTSVATTSKLEDTATTLRQLSLSLSSVRDASRTELDQIITSLVSTIPKIGIELRLMSDTASALQTHVRSLQAQTAASKDASTDITLARIAALSKAKAGLIDARHALREAQAWSTLDSQVTMLLGEERWREAVDRIAKATDSLRLFSGSAKSNEEKSQLLQSLTQRIHQHLVPVLQTAIADRDADKVKQMAELLASTLGGVPTFFRVYTETRSRNLLSRWSETASESSQKPLPAQITSLFGDLLALLGEERVASSSLFSDPNRAIQLLTAHVFVKLDPPIHACIQQATRAPDLESFLLALTDAFKATEEAIRAIQAILPEAKSSQNLQQDDQGLAATSPIDSNLLALDATEKPWLQLMIEPFLPYQTRLATFEAEAMQSRLQVLQSTDPPAPRPVSTASTQALQVAKAALRRSTALTKSFATPSLLPSLDDLLSTAMGRARVELITELQSVLNELQTRIRRQHLSENARQAALTYDERGEVLTSNDWNEFRQASETLSTCRESLTAVRSLEEVIAYQISELGAVAKAPPSTTADSVRTSIDYSSPTAALSTSSLNSTTLHELIAKCKRLLSTVSWNNSSPDLFLLPQARASVLSIASTVQSFQHDLVLSQFLPELEIYPSLPIWTSNKHPSIVNEYDLAMPKFSLSPTEAMARIGEAMLNLPRLFEGYADEVLLFCLDEAKEVSNTIRETERDGNEEKMHARHPTMAGGLPSEPTSAAERSTMHRQAFSTTTIPTDTSITATTTTTQDGDETEAGVLSQYLRSLLTLFLTRFLTTVLPSLPRLTEIGAAQLAADLDYLGNISSVLYAESEAMMRFWKKSTEMNSDAGRMLVAEYLVGAARGGDRRAGENKELAGWSEEQVESLTRSEAFRTVARLRGWL